MPQPNITPKPFNNQDIDEAIYQNMDAATAHEINLYIGLKYPWDKERALMVLAKDYDKIPIADIGRPYKALGNTKWAYKIRTRSEIIPSDPLGPMSI